MEEENELTTDAEIFIDQPKKYSKGSRLDVLITIMDNQTVLLDWLSKFDMPDAEGTGPLYDKWAEHKIKVTSNAMKLVMRCQAEFAKLSRQDSEPSVIKQIQDLIKDK